MGYVNFGLKVCRVLDPPAAGTTREIWTASLESVDPIACNVSFEKIEGYLDESAFHRGY